MDNSWLLVSLSQNLPVPFLFKLLCCLVDGKITRDRCCEQKGLISPDSFYLEKYLCVSSHIIFVQGLFVVSSHEDCKWAELMAWLAASNHWRAIARSTGRTFVS